MMRVGLCLAAFLGTASGAAACWSAIDPGAFASECPIIIRGKIAAVIEAEPGAERADDLAQIRVLEVLKNELRDVPLKPGDLFTVRMISQRNRLRTSTDLNYPVFTEAVWLIRLTTKNEFRIDVHPVQKQPVDAKAMGRMVERVVESKGGAQVDRRPSREEWVAQKRVEAERQMRERARRAAQEKEIRAIAAGLARSDKIEAEALRRFKQGTEDTRRSVLRLRGAEQPLAGDRLVDFVALVLKDDPSESVRVFAADALGYADKPGSRAGAVLAAALRDPSRSVRLFACQAIKHRDARDQAAEVARLLADEAADVRFMALGTLGHLGDRDVVPAVLKMHERDKGDLARAGEFALALAQLGQTTLALAAARQALKCEDWHSHYCAVRGLAIMNEREAVPVVMEALIPALHRAMAMVKDGGEDRAYQPLCQRLEKTTGKKLGLDALAWLDWWETARGEFGGAALTVDRAATQAASLQYQRLVTMGEKK